MIEDQAAHEQTIDELRAQLKEARTIAAEYQRDLQEERARSVHLAAELTVAKTERDEWRRSLHAAEAELANAEREIESLKARPNF